MREKSGDAGWSIFSKTVDEMLSLLKVSVTKHAVIEAGLDIFRPSGPVQRNFSKLR
jgi:hypothetical protein